MTFCMTYIRNGLYVKYFALQNDIIYDTLFRLIGKRLSTLIGKRLSTLIGKRLSN